MAQGKAQFTGAAGQYYLAYGLAVRQVNASLTLGNAPSVDVLASSSDGSRSLAFQVKTSRSAHRAKRYGVEGFEWDVGAGVIGKHRESFLYAFIDLQEAEGKWSPRVFFVPSRWVAEFVKPDWSRYMYFLPSSAEDLAAERWDLISGYLAGEPEAIQWATSWPESRLTKWGETAEEAGLV